jgi:transposase InsO family protein/transposase
MERLKKVYYGPTTFQQRQYLMQVYQNTGSVTEACQAAKVSRGTFYRWHPRFEEQGEAGLQHCLSRAPHRPHRAKEELAQRAIEIKQSRPSLGARSVANRINQEHGYQRVISHETVRRVWKRHSPSCPSSEQESPQATQSLPRTRSGDSSNLVQMADCPDKTVNIDLCFIPRQKLPQPEEPCAAEDSPGETQPQPIPSARVYPGKVFQREDLSYDEQMQLYAQGRREREASPKPRKKVSAEEAALQTELEELRIKQEELRQEGRKARKARKEQKLAWKAERQQRKKAEQERQKLSRKEKKRLKKLHQQEDEQWKANKAEGHQAVEQQTQEHVQRKERRQELKKKEDELKGKLSLLTGLVAVLVVIDNCTRRCLGLPLFLEGRNVKADSIVEALRLLLPPELQYLISDNGSQFKADLFQRLAQDRSFLHVRISPRRPRTNGIAERFVQTTKEMLLPYSWDNPEELEQILASILLEYNDRPHQGKGLDGLSPNELDQRLTEAKAKAEQEKCAA